MLKKNFKYVLAGIILSLSSSASAQLSLNGFYVGPTIAYESFKAEKNRFEDVAPRLTIGYETPLYLFDPISFAIEFWVGTRAWTVKNHHKDDHHEVNHQEVNHQEDDFNHESERLSVSYSYSLAFLPRIMLDNYLSLYLRIGLIQTRFTKAHRTPLGYQVGVGLETKLTDTWNLRGEVDFGKYKSIGEIGKPKSPQVALSAIYRFC